MTTTYLSAAPLAQLAGELRAGRLDLSAHINTICDRIEALDPQLLALLPEPGRRARLLTEAAGLAHRYPDPAGRPPLYGVLVGVKDIIHADGFPTRAGARLPATLFQGEEAASVTALRAAGALILGKTHTTEFAFFEPGPTRNPHNLEHTPGGSSSGSAAAVAAGFSPLTLGTQTLGSVMRPAAYCGIVGFKPSFDRVPIAGVIPFSASLDTLGFFTQDVAGMALAASIICADWQPARPVGRPILGIPTGPYLEQATPAALAAFEASVRRLEARGYAVRRVPAFADIAEINRRHKRLMAGEVAGVHARWFAQHAELYRPRTAAIIREGLEMTPAEVADLRRSLPALRAELERAMDAAGLDLWLTPAATAPAPRGLEYTGDPIMSLPWTHAGLPALALPAGRDADGMPLGVQLAGRFGADARVLAWAEDVALAL
jgi:Asp-tRNA(Asn)/Glu-tRNA(Gln) amidotransferase A subunit family amidase